MSQEQWNEPQKEAITLPVESCLIIAGAGSGKTKVLTSRIRFLVEEKGLKPESIMAVTFTNKAAKEMTHRLEKQGVELKGMWVGTFHGICNKMLRLFHQEAGIKSQFNIIDESDAKSILKRLYKENGWNEEDWPVKDIYQWIAARKEEGEEAHRIKTNSQRMLKFKEIFIAYEQRLNREGSLDFADLINKSLKLLELSDKVKQWAHQKFAYILVDEFQDTNTIQYRWIKALTGMKTPVFAVGDGDQSIYGFRGAKVENIEKFKEEFQLKERQLIRLEQNYRSMGYILEAANAVIKNNKTRIEKNLWTSRGKGSKIRQKEWFNESEEAQKIAEDVIQIRAQKVPLKEIALLYRTNAQSRVLEQALRARGIPYTITGGLKFFERAEVKEALAYLKWLLNHDDETSWIRLMTVPSQGIGVKTLEKCLSKAREKGLNMMEVMEEYVQTEKAGKITTAIENKLKVLKELKEERAKRKDPEWVQLIIERSGLMALYQKEKNESEDKKTQDKADNLKELVADVFQFYEENPGEGLEEYLSQACLNMAEKSSKNEQGEKLDDAVQLMTIHASKGLEFDYVFLSGLEEGLFPSLRESEQKEIEEERRLMYVAITRARLKLTLSWVSERFLYNERVAHKPSRFIQEIPREIMTTLESSVKKGYQHQEERDPFQPYNNHRQENRSRINTAENVKKNSSLSHEREGWKVGQSVKHDKFGPGVIKAVQGQGADVMVDVQFKNSNVIRRLMARFLKK